MLEMQIALLTQLLTHFREMPTVTHTRSHAHTRIATKQKT